MEATDRQKELLQQIVSATEELGWEFVLPDRKDDEGVVGMLIGFPEFIEDFLECKLCGGKSE